MFKLGYITINGIPKAENFNTKEEAEDFVLELMEKNEIRKARIKDLDTGIEEEIL